MNYFPVQRVRCLWLMVLLAVAVATVWPSLAAGQDADSAAPDAGDHAAETSPPEADDAGEAADAAGQASADTADADAESPVSQVSEADATAEGAATAEEAAPASKPALPMFAVGGGEDLWIVQPTTHEETGQATIQIFHRGPQDQQDRIREAGQVTGRVAPRGVASDGQTLWLVYQPAQRVAAKAEAGDNDQASPLNADREASADEDAREAADQDMAAEPAAASTVTAPADKPKRWQMVQSIERDWFAPRQLYTYESRARHPLPASLTLIDFAAGPDDLWALVAADDAVSRTWLAGLSANKSAGDQAAAGSSAVQLLRMTRGGWKRVAMNEPLPAERSYRLVVMGDRRPIPVVLQLLADGGARVFRGDQPTNGNAPSTHWNWSTQVYPPVGDGSIYEWWALSLDNQLILATPAAEELTVALHILRPEKAILLGQLSLPDDPVLGLQSINVAAFDGHVAMIARKGERLMWSRIDIQGQPVGEAGVLEVYEPQPWPDIVHNIMLGALMAVVVIMMVVYMRRDPRKLVVKLPEGWQVADLGPRSAAALIDLLPPLAIGMWIFGVKPGAMHLGWAGEPVGAENIGASLTAIGLFVLHSLIAELIMGTSIGKKIMGLQVVMTDGKKPKWWAIILRNVMKVFDLMFPPLLILPALGITRQRLGDVLANTIVISPRKPAEDEEGKDKSDDKDDQ